MAKRSKERGNLDPLKISEASKSPVAYRIQADTEEHAISQKLYRRSVIEEYTPPIITDDDQAPIKKFQSLEKDGNTTCDSQSRVDIISRQTVIEENGEKCDAEENYLPPPPEFLLQRCSTEERDLPPPPPPFELFTETVVEGTEKVLPEPTPQENSKGLNILYPHNDLTKTLPSKMISPRPGRKRVANKVVGEH